MNKTIRSGARQIMYNVFLRCLAEYHAGKVLTALEDTYKRVADLTGKSESTVRRIVKEGEKKDGNFNTPGKNRKGRPKKDLDDFDICAIRQKIQFFYTVRKEVPTLRKLLITVKDDLGFTGGREKLRQILHSIGFSYKKCSSNREALLEKFNIAAKREKYLKIIMENRNLPEELQKNIVYLDESYIHASYKLKKCWQSISVQGVKQDISKGKRWIIIHAGSASGFVPNALLIFSGNNKTEDYHSEMNAHNFTKWVKDKLIPNLNDSSIIVMDNAPYHSIVKNKVPTSASRIDDIKLWLLENNVQFDPTLRKPVLLSLVKQNKPEPVYEIDEILGEHGHVVVRLPPYHCDLNPIELIWGIAKQQAAQHNVESSNIRTLIEEALNNITVEQWKKSCEHVMKIEKEYYDRWRTLYQNIDELVIRLGEESSDSSTDSEDNQTDKANSDISGVDYIDVEYLDSD